MRPVWKILAPVDLSADPEVPIRYAIDLASELQAALTLLYVDNGQRRNSGRRLEWPAVAYAGADSSVEVCRAVLQGAPGAEIALYADSINANMVVMCPRHYGSLSSFWRGSVTAEVLNSTLRPVCITNVRSATSTRRFRCRRILCVLNLDGNDHPVIRHAEMLAHLSGAELILLGVVPEMDEGLLVQPPAGADRPLCTALARERMRAQSAALFVPNTTTVMVGLPYKCISAAVAGHGADLVLAARKSRNGQGHCLDMRSILRRLTCPLFSVCGVPIALHPEKQIPESVPARLEHTASRAS